MASGYLGKISAVVSVSTADFDNKLNRSAGEVNKFARSLERSLASAGSNAAASLRDIYTPVQKLERALQAVSTGKLQFKGFQDANLQAAADKMRAIFSVAESVSRPLAAASKTVSGLSVAVQRELHPALMQAQAGAESLADQVDRTGAAGAVQFQAMTNQVERFTAATNRAKEAASLIAAMPTGQELRYQRPEMVAEAQRTAAIQAQMASLPPSAMGGMDSFVAQQRAAAEEVERRSAALDNAMLTRSSSAPGNVAAAQAAYQDAVASQAKLNSLIEREVALRREASDTLGQAQRAADNEIAILVRKEQAAKAAESERQAQAEKADAERLAQAQKAADVEIVLLQRREQAAKKAEAERQAQAQKAADVEVALLQRREQAAKEAETRRVADAKRAADTETALLIRRQQREKELERQRLAPTRAVDSMLEGKTRRGYDAQSDVLGSVVSRLSGDSLERGRAALVRFEEAKQRALRSPGDTGLRKELERIGNEAVETIAKLQGSGVGVGALGRQFSRAGDIGRGGFDRFSLALNQAAFAVDDFMSSTGGLEFKLRAVSNNITQMAFVLGGTTGLFVGLGAVIAGQVGVALIKWANGGRTAEDQTKALNDALARQKSLVQELAQAFKSLGDAMSRGTFSEAGSRAQDFDKSLNDIKKKQRERQRESVAGLDPTVLRERAQQAAIERQIGSQTDAGQILNLQRQMRESQERERAAAAAANSRPAPTAANVGEELRASFRRMSEASAMDAPDEAAAAAAREENARRQAAFVAPAGAREAREAIRARQRELGELADGGMASQNSTAAAREEIRRLEGIFASLEGPLMKAMDELANSVAEASRAPAEQIRQAQEEVAKAIEAGIPGARQFQKQLDENAKKLEEAYKNLEQAAEGKDEAGNPLTTEQKQARVEAAQAAVADLEARRVDMAAMTNVMAYERIVEPQKQLDAVKDRARENLGDARLGDGSTAKRLREIDAEMERLSRRAAMPGADVAAISASEEALKREAQAIEATTLALKLFGDALNRASDEAKGNLSSAQQNADEKRRELLAVSTPTRQYEDAAARSDLERQRKIEAETQRELEKQRARDEEMQAGPEFTRIREINEELKTSKDLTAAQKSDLIDERGRLEQAVEPQVAESRRRAEVLLQASTAEEERRKQAASGRQMTRELLRPDSLFEEDTTAGLTKIAAAFENAPLMAPARQAAEQAYLRQRKEDARTQTLAGQGEEAALKDREKFARDINKPKGLVEQITARRQELEGQGVDQAGQKKFLKDALDRQMESVAPMLASFRDERETARLQGPSRAKLTASDATTSQGQAELFRLLRGDDPAKDANLAELRKQTGQFQELIDAVKNSNPGIL